MTTKLYTERDTRKLGAFYTDHVMAMTAEGLHSKSDIAAELAWRDARIAELQAGKTPDGWKLVPLEPTNEMLEAMCEVECSPLPMWSRVAAVLQSAIAAAPSPQPAEPAIDEWRPTAEAVNALPAAVRSYIHQIEANADPAGMIRENVVLRDEIAILRAALSKGKAQQSGNSGAALCQKCGQREHPGMCVGSPAEPAIDVRAMVNRFLGWKLPKTFGPDCGISFTPLQHPNGWPIGTNLFTADQAKAMFEYVIAADNSSQNVSAPSRWVALADARDYPKSGPIDILFGDGSVLCNTLPQVDGDLWWDGAGTGEKFIDPTFADITHWRHSAPEQPK